MQDFEFTRFAVVELSDMEQLMFANSFTLVQVLYSSAKTILPTKTKTKTKVQVINWIYTEVFCTAKQHFYLRGSMVSVLESLLAMLLMNPSESYILTNIRLSTDNICNATQNSQPRCRKTTSYCIQQILAVVLISKNHNFMNPCKRICKRTLAEIQVYKIFIFQEKTKQLITMTLALSDQ